MAAASVEGVSNPASQARVLRVCLKSVESVSTAGSVSSVAHKQSILHQGLELNHPSLSQ